MNSIKVRVPVAKLIVALKAKLVTFETELADINAKIDGPSNMEALEAAYKKEVDAYEQKKNELRKSIHRDISKYLKNPKLSPGLPSVHIYDINSERADVSVTINLKIPTNIGKKPERSYTICNDGYYQRNELTNRRITLNRIIADIKHNLALLDMTSETEISTSAYSAVIQYL